MGFDLETVLGAVKLAGAKLPAFKALFEHVVGTLSLHDQATAKRAYAEEMARTDALHSDVQDALR